MKRHSRKISNENGKKVDRRDFLTSAALLGGCGFLAATVTPVFSRLAHAQRMAELESGEYKYLHNNPENSIYSVCLQCHTGCSLRCKVVDGVLVKIDGNPICAQNRLPNLPYAGNLAKAALAEGRICPKGQSGIETLYDPHRIIKVLKRKPGTPRGGGQWVTVDFNAAIDEIVEGGNLFGEGHVQGMKEVCALRDRQASKSMADDVAKIKKKLMTVEEFKNKHSDQLNTLIDPDHPDLGPKNNQFVFLAGRIQPGRAELMRWFTFDSVGSVNAFEHTTICEQSHHIAYKEVTNNWVDGKWTGGNNHMKPDFGATRFAIFFGTGFSDANFGPPLLSQLVAEGLGTGDLKIAVLDPRLSRSAGKAHWWIPIKPGSDGAFAQGMARWMIENARINRRFLENANQAAAKEDHETAWSTASYMVKIEGDRPSQYLRADEVGVGIRRVPRRKTPSSKSQ
jgi:anaerobic selenocysteine-containing dehydrogenase